MSSIKSTKVKCKCVSKKQTKNYNVGEGQSPLATEIELQVPYDSNSVYHQLSGGTGIVLRTTNQDATDMFVIDSDYEVVISPSEA
jgi:hypothetical protein